MKRMQERSMQAADLDSGFEDLGLRFDYEIEAKEARVYLMRSSDRPAESTIVDYGDGTYGLAVRDKPSVVHTLQQKYGGAA